MPEHAGSRLTLARPLEHLLFFTGEATHLSAFATAYGAYLSGVRAAEKLLEATKAR